MKKLTLAAISLMTTFALNASAHAASTWDTVRTFGVNATQLEQAKTVAQDAIKTLQSYPQGAATGFAVPTLKSVSPSEKNPAEVLSADCLYRVSIFKPLSGGNYISQVIPATQFTRTRVKNHYFVEISFGHYSISFLDVGSFGVTTSKIHLAAQVNVFTPAETLGEFIAELSTAPNGMVVTLQAKCN